MKTRKRIICWIIIVSAVIVAVIVGIVITCSRGKVVQIVMTEDTGQSGPQITAMDIKSLVLWDGSNAEEIVASEDEPWTQTVCALLNGGVEWKFFDMGINYISVEQIRDFSYFASGEAEEDETLDASHSYVFVEFYGTQMLDFESKDVPCDVLLMDVTWIHSAKENRWTYLFYGNRTDFMDTVGALVKIE